MSVNKAIFERNEPTTSSHMITHSPDLENNLQVSPEITSSHDKHDNLPNENNRERIKNSKYPNASFNGIPEKNQPKYIDFPKTLFGKSSRSFSSKWYKEFPWLHYNLDRCCFLLYMYVSRNKGTQNNIS